MGAEMPVSLRLISLKINAEQPVTKDTHKLVNLSTSQP